jgi:hypothetical protein
MRWIGVFGVEPPEHGVRHAGARVEVGPNVALGDRLHLRLGEPADRVVEYEHRPGDAIPGVKRRLALGRKSAWGRWVSLHATTAVIPQFLS